MHASNISNNPIAPQDSHNEDIQLLRRLNESDTEAFAAIYQKYWKKLFDSCYKRIYFREESEEIVQELFVNLWEKRESLTITVSLEAYFFGALRYAVFNWIRSQKVRDSYFDALLNHSEISLNDIEDGLYYEELSGAWERSIEELPDKLRLVYQLSRKENLTYKEISIQLNTPLDTVEKRLGRAMKIIRDNLKHFAWILVTYISNQ